MTQTCTHYNSNTCNIILLMKYYVECRFIIIIIIIIIILYTKRDTYTRTCLPTCVFKKITPN